MRAEVGTGSGTFWLSRVGELTRYAGLSIIRIWVRHLFASVRFIRVTRSFFPVLRYVNRSRSFACGVRSKLTFPRGAFSVPSSSTVCVGVPGPVRNATIERSFRVQQYMRRAGGTARPRYGSRAYPVCRASPYRR